jgi:hypothetical protein
MGNEGSFPGSKTYSSPPSRAEVKNAWSYTSTLSYVFMVWCLVKHRGNFIFTFGRKIFGLNGRKMDHGENCIMMNFITCILRRIF